MWRDVVDLRDFYETQLGEVSQQMIHNAIRQVWPDMTGRSLLGLGYATPYLSQYQTEAERVLAFMPAGQGVLHWPLDGPRRVSLVDECELPLPDYSIDRVLLVHLLEHCDNLRALLAELWRVLTSDGRILVVAPSRRGIWARSERSPFGWGQPYSAAQLSRTLRDHMFTPTLTARALFVPPLRNRALLRAAPAWERVGNRFFPRVSGVVMIEAGKQIYAAAAGREKRRAHRPVLVQVPQAAGRVTQPEPAK